MPTSKEIYGAITAERDFPSDRVGREDFAAELAGGQVRAGILLKTNQTLVAFALMLTDRVAHPYAVSWVKPPMTPGEERHAINISTGVATPYSLAAGYSMTMFQKDWTADQDIEMWLYFDSLLVACPGISGPGANLSINMVYPYISAALDPTSASAHQIDGIVKNRGGGLLTGGFVIVAIVEKVGSPPWPSDKETQCPFCEAKKTVPVGATSVRCDNCGQTYYLFDTSRVRRL